MPSTHEVFVLLLAAAIFSFCAVPVSERFAILGLIFLLLSGLTITRHHTLRENVHRDRLARRDAKISKMEADQHKQHSEWQDQLYCKDARYACLEKTNAGLCEELAQAKRALNEAQDSLPPPTRCYRQHFVPDVELVRKNADLKSRIEAKSAGDAESQTLIQRLKAKVKQLSSSEKALEREAVQLRAAAAEWKKNYDRAEEIVGMTLRQRSGRDVKVSKDAGTQADGPTARQVPNLGFSAVTTLVDSPPVTVAARPTMADGTTQTPAESEQGAAGALNGTTVPGSQTDAPAPSRMVKDVKDKIIGNLRKQNTELGKELDSLEDERAELEGERDQLKKERDDFEKEVDNKDIELVQQDNAIALLNHRVKKQDARISALTANPDAATSNTLASTRIAEPEKEEMAEEKEESPEEASDVESEEL